MPSQGIKSNLSKIANPRCDDNHDTWTDGFPRCRLSGIGTSQNQVYRDNRSSYSEHEYEDQSIHFCIDPKNETYLYGVFDGHDGSNAANFVSQRMPAELSFEQLENKTSEAEVMEIFRQAFISVENAFLESIDPKIAERAQVLEKIPDSMTHEEATQQFPDTITKLQSLDQHLRGGTTAVVALVHQQILYVGNVGDSRALLCQKDKLGVLKVKQLTTDHNTDSHDELERLGALGLDVNKIKGASFGNHNVTRCIGNYFLKGGYNECELLSAATAEPVICDPFITATPIDDSCSFLLLMSDGLYKSYEEATKTNQVNKEIATMVVEQFLQQQNLTSVAQTTVDKIVGFHHNAFLGHRSNARRRDDITLLIRNFNFRNPGNFQPYNYQMQPSFDSLPMNKGPMSYSSSSSDEITLSNSPSASSGFAVRPKASDDRGPLTEDSEMTLVFEASSSTTSSKLSNPSLTQLTLNEQGCIKPYICFDSYLEKIDEAIANGTIPSSQVHLYK